MGWAVTALLQRIPSVLGLADPAQLFARGCAHHAQGRYLGGRYPVGSRPGRAATPRRGIALDSSMHVAKGSSVACPMRSHGTDRQRRTATPRRRISSPSSTLTVRGAPYSAELWLQVLAAEHDEGAAQADPRRPISQRSYG